MEHLYRELRTYEVDCELETLGSLLLVLTDQIEGIQQHAEPLLAAKLAADLARIAHDCLSATLARLREREPAAEAA